MSQIESLTEDEREAVRRGTCQASGPKALRILDAQAADVERLRADRKHRIVRMQEAIDAHLATATSLAAANALLERCDEYGLALDPQLKEDVRAHLAAQPATAPTAFSKVTGNPMVEVADFSAPTRADAEQRVLDACEQLKLSSLGAWRTGMWAAVAKAELARRAVK
jgi:hypothetical protein